MFGYQSCEMFFNEVQKVLECVNAVRGDGGQGSQTVCVCVCGSDDKLLRDNHTISSDGEGGQSEDIMNCQYREKEALFGIARSHTYLTISAVCAGRKLQTALRLMAQRPNLAPC